MQIGCFALIEPFTTLHRQFQLISEMGFTLADVTDNHDGASLGVEFGFAATASLDAHPGYLQKICRDTNITLSAVCAHANLLDPSSPDTYATAQIIKAIRLAHHIGISQVITTEGDPKTAFGHSLTHAQRLFSIAEKLHWPIQWAKSLNIELLLEPHGIVTDNVDSLAELLDLLGEPDTVGINLDTGNSWLGGANPLEYITRFGKKIRHVHWKDMPKESLPLRGKRFGCGMATIPLGDGIVGIQEIVQALDSIGFSGPTTLEVAGRDAVLKSAAKLRNWSK